MASPPPVSSCAVWSSSFLEARYLIYRKEIELGENDLPEEDEPDWEETMYRQYEKRILRFQYIIINH